MPATPDVPLEAPEPLRTLYVDRSSKGGKCSDAYTATENAQAHGQKPWCTLGVAGANAVAGDLVLVRSGSTPYSEPSSWGLGLAVLSLAHLGQAYGGALFPADPATNAEGSNMLFSPNPALTEIVRLADDVQMTLDQFKVCFDATKYGWGEGDLGSHPLFRGAPNFSLQTGSPAINSGDPANHAPRDVTGQAYKTPDRGVFKY